MVGNLPKMAPRSSDSQASPQPLPLQAPRWQHSNCQITSSGSFSEPSLMAMPASRMAGSAGARTPQTSSRVMAAGEWQTSPPCSAAGTGLTHTSCHLCLPQLRGEQNYALPHSSYHTGAQEPTAIRTTNLTGGLIRPRPSRSTDRPMDPTRMTGEAQSMRAKAPSSLKLSDKTNQLPGTSAPVTMGRFYPVIWGAIGEVDQRSDVI